MSQQNDELKSLFLSEAMENSEELNTLFTQLEKNNGDKKSVQAVFRITHTLKANAAAVGYEDLAALAHLLEDIFSEIGKGKLKLDTDNFNDIYRANDTLRKMIEGIRTDKKVSYKGLAAKLKVMLRNTREEEASAQPDEATEQATEATEQELAELNQEIEEKQAEAGVQFSDRVQVPVAKLDALMNLVGELAIEKDRIITENSRKSGTNEFARLYRITSDLQYSVMGVRLVQVSVLFSKFHRIVRDVAVAEGKKVELVLKGTGIEIDRNVLQSISDSMIHMVRNAVSHGLEAPEQRKAAGKSIEGTITLSASNQKDSVIIEVKDDGKGMDVEKIRSKAIDKGLVTADVAAHLSRQEVLRFIFEPGFSSVDQVTDVSGRGVGMDVVRKSIDGIGGKLTFDTELGKGTSFRMFLPSSMAVKSALLFMLQKAEFAIPLSYTQAVISQPYNKIHKVSKGLMTTYLDDTIPVIYLNDIFSATTEEDLIYKHQLQKSHSQALKEQNELKIIIVQTEEYMIGLVVDHLLQQKEIIEKPLTRPIENIRFISGATILGNGHVCLVLDVPAIIDYFFYNVQRKAAPRAITLQEN
jgi:two-component system chemotaxis sensor kinase CheA